VADDNPASFAVDLTNCDREPIHVLGQIQPFGFLIALGNDWLVARVSDNIATFTGRTPDELLGRPITGLVSDKALHAIRNRLAMLRGPHAVERLFAQPLIDGRPPFDVAVHMSGDTIIIEAEPAIEEDLEAAAVVRKRCAGRGPAVRLLSSDLVRAAQTADVIAQRLAVPVELEPALREQGLGRLEGRLTRELTAEPTPEGVDVTEVRWGGGESIEDVHDRLGRLFTRVLPSAEDDLVLVTHGDTLRVAIAWLLGRSHREVDWDPAPNGSVTTLEVDPARLLHQQRLSRHQRRASGRTAGLDSPSTAH